MMRLSHRFIAHIPEQVEEGIIYISTEYSMAIHKCCCGCGKEVVTPLSPTDWKLIFDGKTVSLYPSIGNWSFECQSHYFIINNMVEWAPRWTKKQIEKERKQETLGRSENYQGAGRKDKGRFSFYKIRRRFLSKKNRDS